MKPGISNQSPSLHHSDSSISVGSSRSLSRTASNMSMRHLQSMDSVIEASVSDLNASDYDKAMNFLETFAVADENNPQELSNLADSFVKANSDNPKVLSAAANYLNAQGLVLRGEEISSRADLQDAKTELANNITAYLSAASSQNADPTADLEKITVSPVFTAHPTNLSKPESSQITHNASSFSLASMEDKTDSLKESLGNRTTQPTVLQEAHGNHNAIRNVMKSAHRVHKAVNESLQANGLAARSRPMIEAGNWVGGDRDGNPNVDAKTMKQIAIGNAELALGEYSRKLDQSKLIRLKPHGQENLRQLVDKAGQAHKAQQIQARLDATVASINSREPLAAQSYANPDQLIADLQSLDFSSLNPAEQQRARTKLDGLVMDVKTSGFHGTTTDIRQNSAVNEQTIATLLDLSGIESNYSSLSEGAKQYLLNTLLNNPNLQLTDTGDGLSAEFQQEMGLINGYKEVQDKLGKKALGNCITANTETASDLMEVMVLLRHAGVAGPNNLDMNIVGLIETVDDLKNAPTILNGLLSVPWYSNVMKQSNSPQMVMVGYSDSSRLDGSLSSNWEVYNATHTMMDVGAKHDTELKFFHGRGGTESRGAGQDYSQEIMVHDSRSLEHGFRQTEQGEEVGDKFGNKDVATVNMSKMLGTTLAKLAMGPDQDYEAGKAIMQPLAETARASYHDLVSMGEMPRFYQSSTPIEFVGQSNAGSRPASRKASPDGNLDLSKLRAIPWAACWTQARAMVPAFYGTGTAINEYTNTGDASVDSQRMEGLQQMYQSWPFFQNLVDRTELALAKSDMGVFRTYVPSDAKSQAIADKIENEYNLTTDMVNQVKGQSELLENRPEEKAILQVKKPVLNRSNAMQAAMIKSAREGGPNVADQLKGPMVISMQSVANSLGRFG